MLKKTKKYLYIRKELREKTTKAKEVNERYKIASFSSNQMFTTVTSARNMHLPSNRGTSSLLAST